MIKFGSWEASRDLLKKAAEYFPASEKNTPRFKEYETFLKEDEFELALDSLEELLYETGSQKDEYWLWNCLRTASENMRLTDKEQYYRGIITELLLKNRELVQIDYPDVIGELKYLSWFEKGRISPIVSGYRAQFKYDDYGDWSALQQLIDREICFPNETAQVKFKFYVDNVHKGKFFRGQKFEIREGSTIVAIGKIIEIPRIEYRKAE